MITPTYYIPIAGTWDADNAKESEWWEEDSPFNFFMRQNRAFTYKPAMPFEWSTALDGLPFGKNNIWRYAGKALKYYLEFVPYHARNIIAHSHAYQLVAFCAAEKVMIRNLITIGSPIRKDMMETYIAAQPFIESHLHIRDDKWDLMGTLGQLFDGNWSLGRKNTYCDYEDVISDISHSRILRDKTKFELWNSKGWLEFLANGRKPSN